MPARKTHQGSLSAAVVNPAPPPEAGTDRKAAEESQPPRLRGKEDARHPAEDGERFAEDGWEARTMVDIEPHLRYRYSKREDVYVGINQLVYYSEGVKPKRVAVDIFVSFDVPSYPRDIYRIAEEGKPPDWVIEVASPSTFQIRCRRQEGSVRSHGSRRVLGVRPAGLDARSATTGVGARTGRLHGVSRLGAPWASRDTIERGARIGVSL